MAKKTGLTPRGKALRWMTKHRGCTEQPPGSNTDKRVDGIRAAQRALGAWLIGLAWCGTWVAAALRAAGVVGVTFRLASVANIEDDARAGRAPFFRWVAPGNWRQVLRGDLVVLFGRGVHVGMVRAFKWVRGIGWVVITEEGNTSRPGQTGSQSDGGVSTRRERPLSVVHGFAKVDFPGGAKRRSVARAASLVASSFVAQVAGTLGGHDVDESRPAAAMRPGGSDDLLWRQLARRQHGRDLEPDEASLLSTLEPPF